MVDEGSDLCSVSGNPELDLYRKSRSSQDDIDPRPRV